MKKQLTIILSIVLLLIAIVSITWVGAYNGAIEKNNDVIEKKVGVHAAMTARYEKSMHLSMQLKELMKLYKVS